MSGPYDAEMQIYLDDVAVEVEGSLLGELLQGAAAQLSEAGRIVAEVQIDGQGLSPEGLQEASAKTPAGEVRLISADGSKLALDVLEQVQGRLGETREEMAAAAELLQQDRMTDAMAKVGSAMGVWQQVQQAVSQSATLMRIDLDSIEYEGKSIAEWSNTLLEQFQQLRSGIEAADTVALSDALAYEWPEQIGHWQGILGRLMTRIAAKKPE
jgi:hypothetical protein